MLQVMKLFCLLSAVSSPPHGSQRCEHSAPAQRVARGPPAWPTIGALRPGHKADLVLIDLPIPLRAAQQRGAPTRLLRFRPLHPDGDRRWARGGTQGRATRVDEAAFAKEVEELMPAVRADVLTACAPDTTSCAHSWTRVHWRAWARPLPDRSVRGTRGIRDDR
jgi:hypothetical protein